MVEVVFGLFGMEMGMGKLLRSKRFGRRNWFVCVVHESI